MKKTIRVETRKGFWWGALFALAVLTVMPMQLAFYWTGRALAVVSDLLNELFQIILFKEINK